MTTARPAVGIRTHAAADPSALTVGGIALALGSLGVVATSALYALSPPAAALPGFQSDLALAGAIAGARKLAAAGLVGIFSDVVMATGVLVIALELFRRERAVAAAGWIGIFLSVAIFILVDATAAWVLGPLAGMKDAAFAGFKLLFDVLFLLGTAAFGGGATLALLDELRAPMPMVGKSLAAGGVLIGLAAILASAACFVGLPFGQGVGISVALGSALFAALGVQIARSSA
ncbi:hypothetical protein JQ604_27410 [Bradyrhizobium jicamae]|uniref:hypothetical protein n=1 Tax=Bradyrhizobium jicamae TaxID=280332 RepID=UPI001BA5D41A|nr:hypothetical protein [Bradyrhizobium jicamae]MBR0755917.1 hypothetical protein [Bradyrhizobium jicamae]